MLTTIKLPIAFSETGKRSYKENVVFPDTNSQNVQTRLFMVCAGDGGDEKSEVGANIIAQHFSEYFAKSKSLKTERLGQVYMNDMLRHTERKLQTYIGQNPKMADAEGSVALLYFNEDGSVSAAWVGNCRIYQIRNGEIVYHTEDHIVSNWQPKGGPRTKPRSINANDSAWASVTTLTDVLANDYFLICSPGITETIDDRHIRYLFSQTDNTDNTNRAIALKIKDECAKSSQGSYSAVLLQIEKSPFKVKAPLAYQQPATQKPTTGQIKPPKNLTGAIEMPRESKLKMPQISINPAMLRNLGIAALVLLVIGGILLYKMYSSTPDKLFAAHLQKAETQNQAGAYESAISELEAALLLQIPDSLKNIAQVKLVANKQDLAEREAKKWLDKGNLLKAQLSYNEALSFDTSNVQLKKQIADLRLTIGSEKKKLLTVADSLLRKQQYETAKGFLFDALYLDQSNARIVKAINLCNVKMGQDTLSLEIALKEANTKAETGKRTILSDAETQTTTVTVPMVDSAALKAAAARKRRRANDSINSFYNNNTYGEPIYNSPARATQGAVQSGTGGVVKYGVSETHTNSTTTPTRVVTPPPAALPTRETTTPTPENTKPDTPK